MKTHSPEIGRDHANRNVICGGKWVDICIPLPSDYPFLISLRNRDDVRKWFVDARRLEIEQASAWLAARSDRTDDVLLLIRYRNRDLNVGSIGWTHLNKVELSAEFGRLAVDPEVYRSLARSGESREILSALALDACRAIRDYAFTGLGLNLMRTCYKTSNTAAAAINEACGMSPRRASEATNDGMVHLELTRQHWEFLHSRGQ